VDLNNVAVAIRPRNRWEAIDLGFRMAREYWRPLFGAWICVFVPLVLLIHGLLADHPGWALVAIWWLKPIADRVLLLVLSRAVFSAVPTVREVLKALPGALRNGAVHALTFARLDLARSFNLSVWQLEGLKGKTRRQRVRTLERGTRGAAVWNSVACWHIEGAIFFGLCLLTLSMIPPQFVETFDLWQWFTSMPLWLELTRNAFYVLAVLIVEPFFVAAGFCLYLNRRIVLEGWDIEIVFRRMAPRLASSSASVTS